MKIYRYWLNDMAGHFYKNEKIGKEWELIKNDKA